MTRPLIVSPAPVPPAPPALVAVDRAASELRRGGFIILRDELGVAALVQAAEATTPETLARLRHAAAGEPRLALTGRRAAVLGLGTPGNPVYLLAAPGGFDAAGVRRMADPCAGSVAALPGGLTPTPAGDGGIAAAAVALTKVARLLPAALIGPETDSHACASARPDLLGVAVAEVLAYQVTAARTLSPVSEARVPLAGATDTRIVAFRPSDGGIEHLAIIIGEPDRDQPVLTRLHSECFTGDLLGSLRCDCGDQLRGAIGEIAAQGAGVLLYLAQEGRGIGLVNKLRAYMLQDEGFDTLDANGQLGFDDDERIYQPAAQMLRLLGIASVRLLTNNPAKVEALGRHSIAVSERVPHVFPANEHNRSYLDTKASRGGHLF